MRVYIIGMPGAGKSRFGSQLAKAIGIPFIDIDTEIEKKEQIRIRQIVEEKGETYFRQLERETLMKTILFSHAIISCGGGTPCFFNNMDWINEHGKSIWLDVPHSVLLNRIFNNQSRRPMFSGLTYDELGVKLVELLKERKKNFKKSKIILRHLKGEGVLLSSVIQALIKAK